MYYQSTLPNYPLSRATGEYYPRRATGEYFTPNRGVGEYFQTTSGLGAFTQAAAGITGLSSVCSTGICGSGPLGADVLDSGEAELPVQVALAAAGLAILGLWIYMGYKIGEDLSPNGRNWGVGGALVSLLGPLSHYGYGIMALSNGR